MTRIHVCGTGPAEKAAFLASQLIWSQQISTLTASQIPCDRTSFPGPRAFYWLPAGLPPAQATAPARD
ncbi:hypothetical protein BC342_04595 [Streptomyces olivaceus]|nr:hypothetical protein BC342_04595 [Streptomyces olivaceus]